MKRYICVDCKLTKRASNPHTNRCRKCANAWGLGSNNRPNRKVPTVKAPKPVAVQKVSGRR
jgi:hypothetical protein